MPLENLGLRPTKDEEAKRRQQLYSRKSKAKKKGIPFNITLDDLEWGDYCPVLGIPFTRTSNGMTDNTPTLDRVDPSKGYVKGNVIVISALANKIKSTGNPERLMRVACYFSNLQKEEGISIGNDSLD